MSTVSKIIQPPCTHTRSVDVIDIDCRLPLAGARWWSWREDPRDVLNTALGLTGGRWALLVRYPVEQPANVTLRMPQDFTVRDVLTRVAETYAFIYEHVKIEESQGEIINATVTDGGPFRVYGHALTDLVLTRAGGFGAVRELCDRIAALRRGR